MIIVGLRSKGCFKDLAEALDVAFDVVFCVRSHYH